jgi:hypothetical protein
MRLLRQHAPNDWIAPLWEMREMVEEALALKRNRQARAA